MSIKKAERYEVEHFNDFTDCLDEKTIDIILSPIGEGNYNYGDFISCVIDANSPLSESMYRILVKNDIEDTTDELFEDERKKIVEAVKKYIVKESSIREKKISIEPNEGAFFAKIKGRWYLVTDEEEIREIFEKNAKINILENILDGASVYSINILNSYKTISKLQTL